MLPTPSTLSLTIVSWGKPSQMPERRHPKGCSMYVYVWRGAVSPKLAERLRVQVQAVRWGGNK